MVRTADTEASVRERAATWFRHNWNPDISLGEWWALLAASGWGFPTFPRQWFGLDLPLKMAAAVNDERKRIGAAAPPTTIGARVLAPLVLDYGTEDQKRRYLFDTLAGSAIWCELFSEPGYGSDLADLATRAVRDGDEWVLNGQKVWSSGAEIARWGLVVVRTEPDLPKQQGLTCFVVDMDTHGIETRPLRVMTGEEKFNEVFFTDVRVPNADVLGTVSRGWDVTKATLALERKLFGPGAGGGGLGDNTKRPTLERPAGDVAAIEQAGQQRGAMVSGAGALELIRALLARIGEPVDPIVRQDVARLHCLLETARYTNLRIRAATARGEQPGPEASVVKLLTGKATLVARELALRLEGPAATLSGPDAPFDGVAQRLFLTSPSMSIMAGTDEIQRNIIGERVLGLPSEPSSSTNATWRELHTVQRSAGPRRRTEGSSSARIEC